MSLKMELAHFATLAHCASEGEVRRFIDDCSVLKDQYGWSTYGMRALHQAVEFNDDAFAVQALLKHREIDVNSSNKYGLTPLHLAAMKNRENIVKCLLTREDLDANPTAEFDLTPLHFAARLGHAKVLKLLLADPRLMVDARTIDDFTAFHLVAEGDDQTSDLYLVSRRGSVEDRCEVVRLLRAEQQRRGLLGFGNDRDVLGRTPLHYAAENGHTQMVQEFLVVTSSTINSVDVHGLTPLHLAVYRGHKGVTNLLLQAQGIDINLKVSTRSACEALLLMANPEERNVTSRLFRVACAEEFDEPSNNMSSLHIAARAGHAEIVSLLLSSEGVNTHAVDSRGLTALDFAAQQGHLRVVQMLLEQSGVGIYASHNVKGLTAIVNAVMNNHLEITQVLLAHVKTTLRRPEELVPLWTRLLCIVTSEGKAHKEIAEYLLDNIEVHSLSEVAAPRSSDTTLVHWAAKKGDAELVRLILTWRPENANALNNKKRTPLHLAAIHGHFEVVKALCKESGWHLRAAEVDTFGDVPVVYAFEGEYRVRETQKLLLDRRDVREFMDRSYKINVDTLNSLFVGAVLVASVTFVGWLQPPLGFSADYDYPVVSSRAPSDTFLPFATVKGHVHVKLFFILNSVSFIFALMTIYRGAVGLAQNHKMLVIGYVPRSLRASLQPCFWAYAISCGFFLAAFVEAGRAVVPPDENTLYLTVGLNVIWGSSILWGLLAARRQLLGHVKRWWRERTATSC